MHTQAVRAKLPTELTHSLKEWQRLDVAHGTAYFGDDIVVVAGIAEIFHATFDFVGDMRYYLDGLSEVVAAALLVNHALIDTAGGHIVCTRGMHICKALVVTEVEVGFMAVFGHITLAVFVGVEGARVDVDIRVEFLDSDT